MPEVVMVCSLPAGGKSSLAKNYTDKGYVSLNRDKAGGKVVDLVPKMVAELKNGKNIVLDNLFCAAESRQPFVQAAKQAGVDIHCVAINTSKEDAQINALHRMWERHGKIFMAPDDLKGVNDPNMFPLAVIFKYAKEWEKPTTAEGFASVKIEKFVRRPYSHKNKALILDYDDTLRTCIKSEGHGYPTSPDNIRALPKRQEILADFAKRGYKLLGVSNQSGVAKKSLTYEQAVACFEKTNELVGHEIEFHFCPHHTPPACLCYCRKPQSGHAVLLIEKHQLNPTDCIFVGDKTTDKTFAQRVGFQYHHPDQFFK